MDSLTEINNDMRFEHFIDESLDIDMSACAPILGTSNASFFDEILNTATVPSSSLSTSASAATSRPPAATTLLEYKATSASASGMHLQQHHSSPLHKLQQSAYNNLTHEYIVRPIGAVAKRLSPTELPPPKSMLPSSPLPRPLPLSSSVPQVAAVAKTTTTTTTVRLFGMEQTVAVQRASSDAQTPTTAMITIKSEPVSSDYDGRSDGNNGVGHMFLAPPGRQTVIRTTPKNTTSTGLPSNGHGQIAADSAANTTASALGQLSPGQPVAKKAMPIEFFCHHCELHIKSHADFETHYRTTHSQTPPSYACALCPKKQFGNLQSYRTHVKRHGERHPCEVCTRKFRTAELLAEHGRTHTSELRLQCGHCQEQFDDFTLYCQHVRVHRRPPAAKTVKWKCPDCGKLFKNRAGLNNHAKVHRDTTSIPATATSIKPSTPNGSIAPASTSAVISIIPMSDHTKSAASTTSTIAVAPAAAAVVTTPATAITTTVTVNRDAASKLSAAAAAQTNGTATTFGCDVCDKTFTTRQQLLRHRDHHNERSFKCLTCHKFYKTERDLKVHSLVHYEQRPHACTHCGKSFLSSSKLKQHSNVHTGERPFKCKYCDKDFTNFPNWLKHVRRSHKVDHKTGEHLEQLPNFLVRSASSSRVKKEPLDPDAPPKPKATTARKTKAQLLQQQKQLSAETAVSRAGGTAKTATNHVGGIAAAAAMITIKQEQIDSALDLHDTNATPATPVPSTTSAASVYQDEASLPLDLRDMSASIQLQQSIDVHDVQQMQLLIPSHDESFASIDDVPTSEARHSQQQRISPTTMPANNKTASLSKNRVPILLTPPSAAAAGTKTIKQEPRCFSFARAVEIDSLASATQTSGGPVSFLSLITGQSNEMLPATATVAAAAAATSSPSSTSAAKKQLSPIANVSPATRRHFGGVATSHHMFATNVL